MRQHLLSLDRLGSMISSGRVFYYRAMMLVGNGKGLYGFGTGFGVSPKEARADGALKALSNLQFLDYDPGRTMMTPVQGKEFHQRVTLVPRAMGKGLRAYHRYLPIPYLLGLDNLRMRLAGRRGTNPMFTRQKALQRCLDQVMSRRTLSAMTGKKYGMFVAPGDHWVHWPDRWFKQIRKVYDAKHVQAKSDRRRNLNDLENKHWRKHRSKLASHLEVRPGFTRHAWMNGMQKWVKRDKQENRVKYDPVKPSMVRYSNVFGNVSQGQSMFKAPY